MPLDPRYLANLRACLPPAAIIDQTEALAAYECDGLSAYRQRPALVVLPETVEQVQAVMRHSAAAGVPIVGRGAGTGLSGGALPVETGIVLGLSRMDRILKLDPVERRAVVQPGVRNLAVSEAARAHGLYYAPDPSSQIACSIGGNVAENSGGVHCLKYGLTVHNTCQLKVVASDGSLLTIGGAGLDMPGFDLLALMHGSEGLLGIVVEATLKLLPLPAACGVVMGVFPSVEQAGDSVARVIGAGLVPAAIEMLDNPAVRAVEAFISSGYPLDAAAVLLCEVDGGAEEVAAQTARVDALFREGGAREIRIATDPDERARFWAGRKAAFPAAGRLAPDYYCIDGTIPRRHIGKVLESINRLGEKAGLAVANVFHAGDGNLHPLILYDASRPGELEKTEALGREILELCVAVGGTITGEHGVGVEKLDAMCGQFAAPELAQFDALRRAFDPDRLLNPGKAIPTLARCAEHNAMHVHAGQVPFPELERF